MQHGLEGVLTDTSAKPLSSLPIALESAVQQHNREQRQKRYEAIVATIPSAIPAALRKQYKRYARLAVESYGRRGLRRVHWPWTAEPQTGRVPRGRRR
jgi:hypothetical protein